MKTILNNIFVHLYENHGNNHFLSFKHRVNQQKRKAPLEPPSKSLPHRKTMAPSLAILFYYFPWVDTLVSSYK